MRARLTIRRARSVEEIFPNILPSMNDCKDAYQSVINAIHDDVRTCHERPHRFTQFGSRAAYLWIISNSFASTP